MRTLDIEKAPEGVADLVRDSIRDPILITAHGRPLAGVFPLGDVDWETISLGQNPEFVALLRRSWERLQKEGGIPHEEVWSRLSVTTPRATPPFEEVWSRLLAQQGKDFYMRRGRRFAFVVKDGRVQFDTTRRQVTRDHLEAAYRRTPLEGIAAIDDLPCASYIYAILMDPRIRLKDW